VHLTKLFLPQIRAREGKVMNVGSVAGFVPGPYQSIYYASKAFVISFSEALAEELSGTGATVTCLCPGPVETNFQQRAGSSNSGLTKSGLLVDVGEVARAGYEGMKQGKRLAIPGWKNRAVIEGLRLSPRSTVAKIVAGMNGKKK
jgi:uncharacterized protein